jgi:hypothetical protein
MKKSRKIAKKERRHQMEKFFYLLSAAAIGLFVQSVALSQISITTGDMSNYFGAGKSLFIYGSSDTVMMNVGTASSSAPQTWSAPSVNINDSVRLDNVLPSSTPYASDFPGATYAQKSIISDSGLTFDIYEYYELSNDSLLSIGSFQHESWSFGGVTIDTSIISHTTQFLFHLPVQLGDVFASRSDTTNFGGGMMEVTTSVATIDAFGTLNLPIGSFGALRSTDVTSVREYNGAILIDSSITCSISWVTGERHQLTVAVDTLSSGNVKVHSVSLTYVGQTPGTFVRTSAVQPGGFMLSQNYPNPFNPSTVISYQIATVSHITLKIYNSLGEEVATLVNGTRAPGEYSVRFDGSRLPSGVYFYRLQSGTYSETRKLVILK